MIHIRRSDKQEELLSASAEVGVSLVEQLKGEYGEIIAFKDVNSGELIDLQQKIQGPVTIEPICKGHDEYISILRHDCEHVLAQAVVELFPNTYLAVGAQFPNGFCYDFHTEQPFEWADLELLEKKMLEIIKREYDIIREVWSMEEAREYYETIGNEIKLQILESLEKQGVQAVTMYRHTRNRDDKDTFVDLCRGPHSSNVQKIPLHFKLNKLSGAEWSGDKSLSIQRIGGVLFETKQQLEGYLKKMEEAKSRDHRKLALQMDLYHIEEHSPGLPFWHPRGWQVIEVLKHYIRGCLKSGGYMEVNTPGLINSELWKKSGHWDVFKENMFCVHAHDQDYALKPMSCPAHVEIFKSHFYGGVKSYSMLPIRMSEFGEVYRNEATGALQGLKRVRKLTQDDGHIFCLVDQIEDEIAAHCRLFKKVYETFGFTKYHIDLSTRPDERLGEDDVWDKAEDALAKGAKQAGFEFSVAEGEGAFYGPKLDFHVYDSLDRKWQCCTVQLDFILPERLDAQYVESDGSRKHPVMIHRAICGSLERFLAIVLENTAGYLPMWIAPVQVVVVPMHDDAQEYVSELVQEMNLQENARVHLDNRNESLGYRIRDWISQRARYLLIVGKKEMEAGTLTLRNLQTAENVTLPKDEVLKMLYDQMKMPE